MALDCGQTRSRGIIYQNSGKSYIYVGINSRISRVSSLFTMGTHSTIPTSDFSVLSIFLSHLSHTSHNRPHITMINVYAFFTLALVFLCLSLNSISPTAAFTAPQPVSSVRLAQHALYAADNDDATSSSTKERKPWEFLRFVSQSSKFVTPPPLPFIGGGRRGSKRKVVQG